MTSTSRRWLVPAAAVLVLAASFAGIAATDRDAPRAAASARPAHDLPFIDHLADELGISREQLLGAIARAGDATIGDLVDRHALTPAQATLARRALRTAATDPSGLRHLLAGSKDALSPYRALGERVKEAVARSLASELGVDRHRLEMLFAAGRLSDAAAAAGVTRAEVLSATRRAALEAVAPARGRGLVTEVQARFLVGGVVAAVAHHW